MSWGRILKRFCAVVATGALFYSQSMACCWNMQRPVSVPVKSENSAMAADHACCHKSNLSVDGVVLSSPGMDCGSKAFQSVALAHSWVDFLLIPYSLEKYSAPRYSGTMIAGLNDGLFDTGPPRFLSLRRLLI